MSTTILAASRRGAACALAAFMLCAASPLVHASSTIKADSLTVGSDLTYPPYAYLESGKPAGFDADFSRLLASKLSLKPVFVDTRFPDLILGMRAHRFDAVASALYVTPERTKLIDFIPYLKTGASLVVLSASSYARPARRPCAANGWPRSRARPGRRSCRRYRARPANPRDRAKSRCWSSRLPPRR